MPVPPRRPTPPEPTPEPGKRAVAPLGIPMLPPAVEDRYRQRPDVAQPAVDPAVPVLLPTMLTEADLARARRVLACHDPLDASPVRAPNSNGPNISR